jgi:hypothetical protein
VGRAEGIGADPLEEIEIPYVERVIMAFARISESSCLPKSLK